ncbi:AAA family ATPase [Mycobacterium sp.]|uniref:AAA family ATPase n=1 Tax=Mycobacterium sp. TaxID=1785 RepID=UPI003D6C527A
MKSNPQGGNRAAGTEASAVTNGHAPPEKPDQADDGQMDMAGRKKGDEGYNPFDTKSVNAKHAEDSQYGSPEAATTISGIYAAEHAVARGKLTKAEGKGGYNAVAALGSILLSNARSTGLVDKDHRPSEADVARWHAKHALEWEPTEATVDLAGLKAAIKGLDHNRKIALTTIDALADEGKPWAINAVARAQLDNLDMSIALKDKTVAFTLSELFHHYGAAADDLAGLPEINPETRVESYRLLRQWTAAENLRAQDGARTLEVQRKLTGRPAPELFIPKDYVEDHSPHLIDGLLKSGEGSSAVLPARRKAGKSSLIDEAASSMMAGEPFCGRLSTRLPEGWQVVILDTEMSNEDINDTYVRCLPLMDDGRVKLWRLIGRAGLLDVRTERARRYWDAFIPEHSVIIVDPLGPIIAAAGIKENSDEVAQLLDGLFALAVERRSVLLVTHHMGKDEEQGARGHSSIEDKFGAIWHLTYKGHSLPTDDTPRYLTAVGRKGIDLPRTKITKNEHGHLVMEGHRDAQTVAAEASAEQRSRDEAVFRMLCLYPARSVTALAETRDATENQLSATAIRDSLGRLERQRRAANIGNAGRHQWVPQWVKDPVKVRDMDMALLTAEDANGLAIVGSTAHEAAVRVCIESICALVKRDESQAKNPDTKMEQVLRGPGYPPRGIHINAYNRWKAACDEASKGQLTYVHITDPNKVPALPTPEWSKGLDGNPWSVRDGGEEDDGDASDGD